MAEPAPPAAARKETARRAAILAGGASRRMGAPKATLRFRSEPLIAHPIAAAVAAGLDPFVVAKADSALPPIACPLVVEPDEPLHPLAGIVAALEHAGAPLVILACDLPLVPPSLIAELARRRSPLALPVAGRPQPLAARYSPALLPRLRAALAEGRPLTAVALELAGERLEGDELRRFGDPERMFTNVNDREGLTRAETGAG